MRNRPHNRDAHASPTAGELVAEMFIAEATDIRDLLSHYQASAAQLKEELGAFVHREIDEQAKFAHLRAAVNRAELRSLRDARFLEYISQREAEKRGMLQQESVSSAAVRDVNEVLATPYWWQCMKGGGSSALGKWAPDAALSLAAFKNMTKTWLGWKQENKSAEADVDKAVATVYPENGEDDAYSCFGNGAVFVGHIEEDSAALQRLESVSSQMINAVNEPVGGEDHRVAVALDSYSSALASAVAMTRSRFRGVMSLFASSAAGGNERCRLALNGDAWDTLVFVRPERLQHTVVLRGFFFRGQLALVEQLGAEVDMTPLFFYDDGDVTEREAHRQHVHCFIAQTLTSLHDSIRQAIGGAEQSSHMFLPTNVALTIAIRITRSCSAAAGGVLLDIHPVTPQLPFDGQVSWMDVCTVGRQSAASAASSGTTTGGGSESAEVRFCLTHLPVAALQPCDTLSHRIFPVLNAHLRRRPSLRQSPALAAEGESEPAPASRDAAHFAWPPSSVTALCFGAAACLVVVLYGAARGRRLM